MTTMNNPPFKRSPILAAYGDTTVDYPVSGDGMNGKVRKTGDHASPWIHVYSDMWGSFYSNQHMTNVQMVSFMSGNSVYLEDDGRMVHVDPEGIKRYGPKMLSAAETEYESWILRLRNAWDDSTGHLHPDLMESAVRRRLVCAGFGDSIELPEGEVPYFLDMGLWRKPVPGLT